MKKLQHPIIIWSLILIAVLFFFILILPFLGLFSSKIPLVRQAVNIKTANEALGMDNLDFDLVDPEQAPAPLKNKVLLGYSIMLNTSIHAGQFVHDKLNCTNCHFAGGNTLGGKNGGISLVGVGAIYPRFDERMNRVIDLPTRINSCFEKSMNGKPIPYDSEEMLGLVTYLQWISKGIPVYEKVSWLQPQALHSNHVPNESHGKKIYDLQCASCHGVDGKGDRQPEIPPLWGDHSFNDAAGMNQLPTLASFIHLNMPYNDPDLTVEEALDVAAFIVSQPRPHFQKPKDES